MKFLRILTAIIFSALVFACGTGDGEAHSEKNNSTLFPSYIRDSFATVDTLDLIFYIPMEAYSGITTTRPLKGDSSVLFVCAAAFTLLENDAIDGLFIDSGHVRVKWVNHSLGGGIVIPEKSSKETARIFGTDMGNLIDSNFIDSVSGIHASFFQQIQLVRDGQALRFQKEFSRFQRRALCIWHGELIVIESQQPCTMQKFANVLKNAGIQNALYVDMGSWDEGWYRNQKGELVSIGLMKNETDRQSNWFVVRAK